MKRRYADGVPDAEQSLRDLDALAAEKVGQRDRAGRLVPCYPGIHVPDTPAGFDKSAFRALLRTTLPNARVLSTAAAAKLLSMDEPAFVAAVQALAWYGWRWKADGVIYAFDTAIVDDADSPTVRLTHNISTPEGSLVLGYVRVTREEA